MGSTDSFFTDGAAYERLMGRWSRRAGDQFIDWIAAAPRLAWIDVGCGTGVFTEELIRRCAPSAVAGIDPSPEQLDYARKRPGLEDVEFRVGGAEGLPFPNLSFDVAVMPLVIHFVPDPAKGVAEMARVLRPGGLACAYVWDYGGRGAPHAPVIAAMKSMGIESTPPPSAHATSLVALDALWRDAGLEAVETRPIRISCDFPGFDDCWDSLTMPVGPLGQAMARLAASDKERVRAALRERLTPDVSGRVAYEAVANAVKGCKPG